MRYFLAFILLIFSASYSMAQSSGPSIPRFDSLRSDTVYMRAGPGERFPIEWVYERKDLPVKVIDSFEHWYKIEDADNNQGWVHKRMLSGKKTAMTPKDQKTSLYKKNDQKSKVLAYFDGEVIVKIIECKINDSFCYVKYNDTKGYILKSALFGVSDEEI